MTREETIKVMNTIIAVVKHRIELPMTVNDIEDACYMAIEALKERPHGEWKYKPMKGAFCSVCGWHSIWKFNFCPNCGADMRTEEGAKE